MATLDKVRILIKSHNPASRIRGCEALVGESSIPDDLLQLLLNLVFDDHPDVSEAAQLACADLSLIPTTHPLSRFIGGNANGVPKPAHTYLAELRELLFAFQSQTGKNSSISIGRAASMTQDRFGINHPPNEILVHGGGGEEALYLTIPVLEFELEIGPNEVIVEAIELDWQLTTPDSPEPFTLFKHLSLGPSKPDHDPAKFILISFGRLYDLSPGEPLYADVLDTSTASPLSLALPFALNPQGNLRIPGQVSRNNPPHRPAIPSDVKREVWRRDEGRCSRCGSRQDLEFDHIIPISKGGSNTPRNIELLCEACNRSKGANI